MTRYLTRLFTVASLLGLAIIFCTIDSDRIAVAQTSTTPPPLTPSEKKMWDELWNESTNDSNPQKRDAARRAIGETMKKNAPYALDKVGKGLTAFAAFDIWYNNYVQLSPVWRDSSNEVYAFDTEFKPAPGAIYTSGKSRDGSGSTVSMMNRFLWEVRQNASTGMLEARYTAEGVMFSSAYTYYARGTFDTYKYQVGLLGVQCMNRNSSTCTDYFSRAYSGNDTFQEWPADPNRKPVEPGNAWQHSSGWVRLPDLPAPRPVKVIGKTIRSGPTAGEEEVVNTNGPWSDSLCTSAGCSVLITPDTYQTGGMQRTSKKQMPDKDDVIINEGDSTTIIREAPQRPEWEPYRTPPQTDPNPEPPVEEPGNDETDPQVKEQIKRHGAIIWTRENPDGSITRKFEDGTEWTVWANGDQMWRHSNGIYEWKYADGTYRQYNPNSGMDYWVFPDGSELWQQYPQPYPRPYPGPGATPAEETWTGPGARPVPNPNARPNPLPDPAPSPAPSGQPGTNPGTKPTTPNTPGSGPPETPAPNYSCPKPLKNQLFVPPVNFGERFPFSLIIMMKNTLGELVGTPSAPSFDLPMLGVVDLSRFDSIMSVMRTVWLVIIGGLLMPLVFYNRITGKGDGE